MLGPPDCTCARTVPRCDACLRDALYYQKTTAWARGEGWAKSVAAKVGTAKPWPPFEGRAAEIARLKVHDLERNDPRIADALARECHAFAAKTWALIATRGGGGR